MFYSRIAIATCMEASAPRDGEECPCFNAKLRLFQNASAPSSSAEHPDSLTLKTILDQHVPIVNTKGRKIAVDDEFIVGQTIDERWVIISDVPHPRIQFVTTGKIIGQSVPVKVLRVQNSAPNLSSGFLKHGDALEIKDPFNLFADIELDATGWAYYVAESEDDTETESITEPTHEARYEIEECSLPINELEGTISSCLKFGDTEKTVTVTATAGSIRSAYNNVDEPPEMSGSGTITAKNYLNLDAINGSKVTIQRVTNLGPSEPEDYAVSGGSATSHEWEIIRVEKKIARWTDCNWTGSAWQQTGSVWDGFDPFAAGCPPSFTPLMTCLPDASTAGIACYNPTDHTYVVVSTASALLGPPAAHRVVQGAAGSGGGFTFDGCVDMHWKEMEIWGWSKDETMSGCAEYDEDKTASLGLSTTPVMQAYASLCGGTCTWTAVDDGVGGWEWQASGCTGSGCNCDNSVEPSTPASEGATYAGECQSPYGAGLCFSRVNVLSCYDPPTAATPTCVPVTECPEE